MCIRDSYYGARDVYWLSHIINAEAGNQPMDGQIAVGNVVLNRVADERFPNSVPQSEIALPRNAQKLLSQYDEACRQLEESTARKQEAENLLKEMLGDHEIGTAGNRVVTWKSVTQERLDTKTLKAEHPALFKKYASQTSYRRFAIKTVRSLGG